jgi:hypothetical protein
MRWHDQGSQPRSGCSELLKQLLALLPRVLQVWTGVETQQVAALKLRKSGGAPSRMVVVRFVAAALSSELTARMPPSPQAAASQ